MAFSVSWKRCCLSVWTSPIIPVARSALPFAHACRISFGQQPFLRLPCPLPFATCLQPISCRIVAGYVWLSWSVGEFPGKCDPTTNWSALLCGSSLLMAGESLCIQCEAMEFFTARLTFDSIFDLGYQLARLRHMSSWIVIRFHCQKELSFHFGFVQKKLGLRLSTPFEDDIYI